jgi:hypothetical protein
LQNRITREPAQASGELAKTEVDWELVHKRESAAVKLVSQLNDIYIGADDATRKRVNQTFGKASTLTIGAWWEPGSPIPWRH